MNFTNSLLRTGFTLAGILSLAAVDAPSAALELKSVAFIASSGVASNTTYRLALHSPAVIASTTANARFTLHGSFPGIRLVQTPGAPRLSISASAAGFRLLWPTAFSGFRLQSTTSLTDPQWTDVPTAVSVIGDMFTVEIVNAPGMAPAPMSFYRLIRP